ncbi:MAG: hypothetical protein HGA85_08090 [Nanoarchaeota archaeon]|nr:hypothetical protein [Nanoarchaeota archaeon]
MNDGEEYYEFMQQRFPDTEFFVFGTGGYGTLQEYMVLNDTVDEIRPDLILWQFCNNDFADNSHDYEVLFNREHIGVRPYLEEENIVYRMNRRYDLPIRYSVKSAHLLLTAVEAIQASCSPKPGFDSKEFRQARAVTLDLLGKVKARSNAPVYFFDACGSLPEVADLCRDAGMICLPDIAGILKEESKIIGETLYLEDGHWNPAGNRIAGNILADYFEKNKILT